MIIYIEYVIIDNMVMNSLILVLSCMTLKEKVPKLRVFISALVGTLAAIVFTLVSVPGTVALLLKILLGMVMCLIAVKRRTKKSLLSYYFVFLAYTFVLGGCMLALLYLMEADVTDALAVTYASGVPVGIIAGGAAVTVWLAAYCIKRLYRIRLYRSRFVEAELTLQKKYTGKAFVDSGNLLKYNGLPVFFAVNRKIRGELLSAYTQNILNKENPIGENAYIPYITVGGEGRTPALKPPEFRINGKITECYIAWCGIKGEEEYDFIIGEGNEETS